MEMKLSVAVAAKEAPPSAFVVWRGFEESIAKAADLGYHGVELALKTADDVDPDHLSTWLSKHNLEVSCISTGQVFASLGLYFTHPDVAMRERVIDLFSGLIHLARDFGKLVNVGRTRGFIAEGQTPQEAEQIFIDTSRRICDTAGEEGVTIIIEPVNRYEINFVNNLDEGADLLAKVARDNLGLMPDVFHMNIEDARIGESLARHASLVKYIHFADSNRHAPGWGHLDFDDVFDGLRRGGFNGWSAIEILPVPDPDSAAQKAAETMLPMIERYNQAGS
jgi:sugar phosphate isomerase/epimerase